MDSFESNFFQTIKLVLHLTNIEFGLLRTT